MAYDFSKVEVLVVESTHEMFKLFKTVLAMLTIPERNIHAAYNVEDAYRLFKRKNFDIVITDWLDNPDSGIALTKRMRTDPTSPNIYVPIIMTAGSGHLSRVLRARDAGISEYLVKPFAANDLAIRITRIIERPRPFAVSETYVGPDRRIKDLPFDGEDRRKSFLVDDTKDKKK